MATADVPSSASAQDVIDAGLAMVAVDLEITVTSDGKQETSIDKMKKLSDEACRQLEKPSYYICNYCRKPFDTQHAVESHLEQCKNRDKEKDETEMYECPECKYLCATLGNLSSHMRQHESKLVVLEDERRDNLLTRGGYRCNICHKAVSTKGNLAKHQIIHLGVKPYKCNFCDKFFTLKGNRDKHELTHTDNRPHKCQICDKRFTLKGNLQQHILTHSDFKFFQCYLCNKEFTLKGNLDKHIKRHANGMVTPRSARKDPTLKKKPYISLREATEQNEFAKTILEIRNIINGKKSFSLDSTGSSNAVKIGQGKLDGTSDIVGDVMETEENEEATMCIPEPNNEVEYDEMAESEEMDNYQNGVDCKDANVSESAKPPTVAGKVSEDDVQNL